MSNIKDLNNILKILAITNILSQSIFIEYDKMETKEIQYKESNVIKNNEKESDNKVSQPASTKNNMEKIDRNDNLEKNSNLAAKNQKKMAVKPIKWTLPKS